MLRFASKYGESSSSVSCIILDGSLNMSSVHSFNSVCELIFFYLVGKFTLKIKLGIKFESETLSDIESKGFYYDLQWHTACSRSLLHILLSYKSLRSRLWFTWMQMSLIELIKSWWIVFHMVFTWEVSRKCINILTLSWSTWKIQLKFETQFDFSDVTQSSSANNWRSTISPKFSKLKFWIFTYNPGSSN